MAIPSLYILFFVFALIAAKQVSSSPSRTLLQDPDLVVQDVERRINTFRRQLGYLSCGTGNPIDDCWLCNSNWDKQGQSLADCAIGFCKNATGGWNGRISVVTDNTDNHPVSCSRYQVQQSA